MKRKTSGFTLVELLVVITIIGIILGFTINNMSKARKLSYSKAAGAHGALVYMTVNGFMSSRPGVTAAQVMASLPDATATAAGVPAGGKNCSTGYTLSGAAGAVTAVAAPTAAANTPAWNNAPEGAECVMTAGGVNAFAMNVYTWHQQLPGTVYLNGAKQ